MSSACPSWIWSPRSGPGRSAQPLGSLVVPFLFVFERFPLIFLVPSTIIVVICIMIMIKITIITFITNYYQVYRTKGTLNPITPLPVLLRGAQWETLNLKP